MAKESKESKVGLWLRAMMITLVVLGAAFAMYGRLVRVETRLGALEEKVGQVHGKLFGTRIADKR